MTIAVDPSLADQGLCHRPSGRWWIAQHPPSGRMRLGRILAIPDPLVEPLGAHQRSTA